MKTPQLVIPMTGVSSRFTAAGYSVPKFLLEIDGQTMIEHVIDMYPDWNDVVFACNEQHLADPALGLERRLLERVPTGRIVSLPSERRGPAWAVLACREAIDADRPVVVNYCDFTAVWDTEGFARLLGSETVAGAIACYTGFHPHMVHNSSYAYVRLGDDGDVVDIQEKQPWTDAPMNELASSGTYGFDSGARLLAAIEDQIENGETLADEYYMSLTFKSLLRHDARVVPFSVPYFMQWGTPQDLEEYRAYSTAIADWAARPARQERAVHADRVILASGAGDRFRRAGYRLPKPALPLSGTNLLSLATGSIPGDRTVLVTREDLADGGLVADLAEGLQAAVVSMPGLSEGQAISALYGMEPLDPWRPVTIGACDAIAAVAAEALQEAIDRAGPGGLVCWTASRYAAAQRRPQQYGWVQIDPEGNVRRAWLKSDPGDETASMIIGTFTFGSVEGGRRAIRSMVEADYRINGEFYLDGLIPRLLEEGLPVVTLDVDSFVSVGTPAEYESVRYWQTCFNGWSLHPYKVAADPTIPSTWRARVAHEMAKPFRTVSSWG